MILDVANKAVFCMTQTSPGIPNFSTHLSNSFVTLPRAPMTTEITCTFLSRHILPISLRKSWDFSTFSLSFSCILLSAGTAISRIIQLLSFLSITTIPCLLASITMPHCMFTSHNNFTHSLSATPGLCSYHFSLCSNAFFLHSSQ